MRLSLIAAPDASLGGGSESKRGGGMTDMTVSQPSTTIQHLTANSFDEIVSTTDGPLLVDFWAPWCGPCRAIAPVLDQIAIELAGQATIGKVNVDEDPALAGRFGVQSIPTLLFFKNGALAETL